VTLVAGTESRTLRVRPNDDPGMVAVADDAFDQPWIVARSLDAVRVEGLDLARPPEILVALAPIVVRRPDGGRLFLRQVPTIAFETATPAPQFRLTISWVDGDVPLALAWLSPKAAATAAGGSFAITADEPAYALIGRNVAARVRWQDVADILLPSAGGRLWSLPVGLRVEGLDASGINVVARSEWMLLSVVR
jgi:hypothetical protein